MRPFIYRVQQEEILGVLGLICAIEAWQKYRLAHALLLAKYRTYFGAIDADGRCIVEIEQLPGCIVYGETEEGARECARQLGITILLDRARFGDNLL